MKQRIINTKIWSDGWFTALKLDEKLFFVYLLTNERTNIAGVYEAPTNLISAETGISSTRISEMLAKFEEDGKIIYKFGWIYMKNFLRYQDLKSFKVVKGIERIIKEIPPNVLKSIGYAYPSVYLNLNPNLNSNSNLNLERGDNIPYGRGMLELDTLSPSQETKLFLENIEFRKKLLEWFLEKGVPQDFLNHEVPKFTSYWCELNKSGTKQRWELEKTFEVKRRLATWFNRATQYQNKGQQKKVKFVI